MLDGPEALASDVDEYVSDTIRLDLCFQELRNFDKKGVFVGKHPFILADTDRKRLVILLKGNPDKFFHERKNIELNITRYKSLIKNGSDKEKAKYSPILEKHKARLALYKDVYEQTIVKAV